MKYSRRALGFGFGSGMASVAEWSLQRYSDYRERGTRLPANGREKCRRKKLLISCLTVASIAGVIVVEPFMFIGFALLYIKMTAVSAASNVCASDRGS
jgi:hypothetical protein